MEQLTGGRCPATYAIREYNHPQDDRSASYAVRDGMETVPVTSSHMDKLEVTEMKMCGHTLRDHLRNENTKERLKVENITERCMQVSPEVVWPRKEARPRLRRKKDSGCGTTRERKARKTEAEMGGLCQPRHRNDERRGS